MPDAFRKFLEAAARMPQEIWNGAQDIGFARERGVNVPSLFFMPKFEPFFLAREKWFECVSEARLDGKSVAH